MQEITGNLLKPIIFKTPEGLEYYDYSDIIMCVADGNCTLVFAMERNSPVRVLCNLTNIEKKYCNNILYRCHKSFIINLMHVEKLIIKTHQVQLKKKLLASLSEQSLRYLKQISV